MKSIIGIIQEVAGNEAAKIYTTELGIVTAVFPHTSEADQDNYQCSVKLKYRKQPDGSDFELRKVPVMTPHIGMANIPNVGDLVVISFAGGNVNAPIIMGRLYNDEDRPPVNKEKELIIQENRTRLTIKDGAVTITTADAQVTLKVEDGGLTIDTGTQPVTLKSSGEIKIGDASTSKIVVGGRSLANAVGDGDTILLTTHTHLGNLGAPCPILIPNDKIDSVQAKLRNTQVG